jgi:hypothetical protein
MSKYHNLYLGIELHFLKGLVMKRTIFAAAFCFSAALALPALADRTVQPKNVIMTYDVLPSGDITMKVSMPEKEWLGMGRDMRTPGGSCRVTGVTPGDMTTMVLVCRAPGE